MAGDWLKIESDTPDKPEILAVAAALGLNSDDAFGKCFRLWRWFDSHTEKGNARGVTKELLNRIIGVSGFCEALEKVGWLLDENDSICLPKFDRHNGTTAKTRALTAKRVAKSKRKGNAKGNAKGNGESVSRSSLSLTLLSCIDSCIKGTSFETEEVRCALSDWCRHFSQTTGKVLGDVKLRNDLLALRQRGLNAEQVVEWIQFSIGIGAKNWKDPADDWSKRSDTKKQKSVAELIAESK